LTIYQFLNFSKGECFQVNKLNFSAQGVIFTDEPHSNIGNGILILNHDTFYLADLVIRTAAAGGGTLLEEDDYTVGGEMTTRSGLTVYSNISIINGAYQTGTLYFSGKYAGDVIGADDFNLRRRGWENPRVLPTRVSDTSFTLPGDWTSHNQKGDKLWAVDGGASKYSVLWGITYDSGTGLTTFTTSPWGNSAGASATFSANPTAYYFSKQDIAVGFPNEIAMPAITYTTSGNAFTNTPSTTAAYFWTRGDMFECFIRFAFNASSGGTGTVYATLSGLPVPVGAIGHCSAHRYTDLKSCCAQYVSAANHFEIALFDGSTCIANSNIVLVRGAWRF
jgi:hypothetical protein